MEPIAAKEFLEQLNSGKLKSGGKIFGLVKKSEKGSELLFSFTGESINWIQIPESMIDHVHLIKQFTWERESMAKVKIRLKEPSNVEAKILYDLISGLSEKICMIWYKKKLMMGKESMHGDWKGHCGCKYRLGSSYGWHHH